MSRPPPATTSWPALRDKVAFLRSPQAYAPAPDAVEAIETHMSWVFLTHTHAFKLKKPIRYDVLDFSSLALRRRSCERELRLNRRLARDVYLDVVPLTLQPDGTLRVDGSGIPTDWLVKMRRLPEERTLERLVLRGEASREAVAPAAVLLAAFYGTALPAPVDAAGYLQHLREGTLADRDELVRDVYRLSAEDVLRVAEAQLRYLEDAQDLLGGRVAAGRIVEGHGDLRPEHVFLTDPPAIIDCLEFSRDLRVLDPLDELGFLALDCERIGGSPEVGAWFFEPYLAATRDSAPPGLLAFYRRFRGLRRAKVAVWHLRDHEIDDEEKWVGRARWYVAAAVASLPGH
jgi:uncharacterized protein